jgi:hypothetical protein
MILRKEIAQKVDLDNFYNNQSKRIADFVHLVDDLKVVLQNRKEENDFKTSRIEVLAVY